jgi:hypothetical protein
MRERSLSIGRERDRDEEVPSISAMTCIGCTGGRRRTDVQSRVPGVISSRSTPCSPFTTRASRS